MASDTSHRCDSVAGDAGGVYCEFPEHRHSIGVCRPLPEDIPSCVCDVVRSNGGAPALHIWWVCSASIIATFSACPYSPKCVEGGFSEVRPNGVLGSRLP